MESKKLNLKKLKEIDVAQINLSDGTTLAGGHDNWNAMLEALNHAGSILQHVKYNEAQAITVQAINEWLERFEDD